MDTPIIAAFIVGWATIIGGLIELRYRTNGNGPLAQKMNELKADIIDVKADVRGLKQDFHDHIRGG